MPNWVLLLATGLGAGVFSGMFGIGGGVIIVPVLIVFFAFTAVEAVATSLAALLLPVGIFAVGAYYRAGLMDVRGAALLALGLLVTNLLGAEIAISLPGDTLKQVYGAFLIVMGWRFAEPRKRLGIVKGAPATAQANRMQAPWHIPLMIGLVAGVFSGMFGIGGGAVIVPALVALVNYDQKYAVGTSLGALLLPVGLPGVVRYYSAGLLDIATAAPVAVGLAAGALFGARLAISLPSATVRQLYGVFLMVLGAWFIVEPLLNLR